MAKHERRQTPVVDKKDDGDGERSQQPEPHLPHESDAASGSQELQTPANKRTARQAKKDVDRGLVDTGRGPVVDKLEREQFGEAGERPAGRPHKKP